MVVAFVVVVVVVVLSWLPPWCCRGCGVAVVLPWLLPWLLSLDTDAVVDKGTQTAVCA